MSSQNPNLERPCPSCGTTLKVNAQRLNQKLQCPKCLSVFVLEGIAAPPEEKPKPATRKKKSPAAPSDGMPPNESESRYRELLAQHVDLVNLYEDVVKRYEQVVEDQGKLADQIRHLSG